MTGSNRDKAKTALGVLAAVVFMVMFGMFAVIMAGCSGTMTAYREDGKTKAAEAKIPFGMRGKFTMESSAGKSTLEAETQPEAIDAATTVAVVGVDRGGDMVKDVAGKWIDKHGAGD